MPFLNYSNTRSHQSNKENEVRVSKRYSTGTSQSMSSNSGVSINDSPTTPSEYRCLSANALTPITNAKPKVPRTPSPKPNLNQRKKKQNDTCEESFMKQQEMEHQLRVKKLNLEIEYAKEEHIAKMKKYVDNLDESISNFCDHCEE